MGTGRLFTTVTRALKAWARFGFAPTQQQQQQQQQQWRPSSSATTLATGSSSSSSSSSTGKSSSNPKAQQPPGYVWEVLVIFVLEQQVAAIDRAAAQLRYETQGTRELNLFLEVLEAASRLLRPNAGGSTAAVTAAADDPTQCWRLPLSCCALLQQLLNLQARQMTILQ
jgi:hypothetical protein